MTSVAPYLYKPFAECGADISVPKALYLSPKPSPLSLSLIFSTSTASKPVKFLRFSAASSSPSWGTSPLMLLVPRVAQTSDWAQQEEEDSADELSSGIQAEDQETEATSAGFSSWEAESESDQEWPAGISGDESGADFAQEESQEPVAKAQSSEEAKVFVGNLPYDVDSEKLAQLFEQAGAVEIAEVIYNPDTDQSRGFGFVTMSTVEEAQNAVKLFDRYDLNGRYLRVNKASPKGSRRERPRRVFEPSFRIFVGNLAWQVDNARLEQVFAEHGKVVDARVVYDQETGRSRGFGFVTMSNETELNDAIAALDGQSLDGRAIRLNVAEERPKRSFF